MDFISLEKIKEAESEYFLKHLEKTNYYDDARLILCNWLADLCFFFNFDRESFYASIEYVDRFMIKEKNVLLSNLQLIGLVCLSLANTMYEINEHNILNFKVLGNQYCKIEYSLMIEKVLKVLDFRLFSRNIYSWLGLYCESIIENMEYYGVKEDRKSKNNSIFNIAVFCKYYKPFFTMSNNIGIKNLMRCCCYILDNIVLEKKYLQYKNSRLVGGLLAIFLEDEKVNKLTGYDNLCEEKEFIEKNYGYLLEELKNGKQSFMKIRVYKNNKEIKQQNKDRIYLLKEIRNKNFNCNFLFKSTHEMYMLAQSFVGNRIFLSELCIINNIKSWLNYLKNHSHYEIIDNNLREKTKDIFDAVDKFNKTIKVVIEKNCNKESIDLFMERRRTLLLKEKEYISYLLKRKY